MQNIAIIKQGTGRYLFSIPDNVALKPGDRVKCDTRRGITDGIAFADSAWVDENVAQLIGKLTGAKFPLKSVVGRLEYLPFEKPQDKPASNPANKYEGMSNMVLKVEMCSRGSCHAHNGWCRKHDCLFADDDGCNDVTDANRAEVIQYLLEEDAANEPKQEDKPAEDAPKFKAGDKAKIIGNLTYHQFGIGEIVTLIRKENSTLWYCSNAKENWYCSKNDLEPYAISFDWDAFKAGKIAVCCKNASTTMDFMHECEANGVVCCDGKAATKHPLANPENSIWNDEKYLDGVAFCCSFGNGKLEFCYPSYFEKEGVKAVNYPFSEQPAEPTEQKETVKLYCVKYSASNFTRGNVYEVINETICFDDGNTGHFPSNFDEAKERYPGLSACLVPLVKRPAKVGEWVYVISNNGGPVREGAIWKVTEIGFGTLRSDCWSINDNNYLVLDGYKPTPEAEPEPEYFSGKVVCVECPPNVGPYTPGKVYAFTNGFTHDDNGNKRPTPNSLHNPRSEGIRDFDDWQSHTFATFVEFKGEAND